MAGSIKTWWGHYFNDRAELIGHDSADVAKWLAAHPAYTGDVFFNFGDGSDDMTVTEIFSEEADEAELVEAA